MVDVNKYLSFLNPREISEEEYQKAYSQEIEAQRKASFLGTPDPRVRCKAQAELHSSPLGLKDPRWHQWPTLGQPYTREYPRHPAGTGKKFATMTPVILSREELNKRNEQDYRDQQKYLQRRRDQITNPRQKAWQYLQDIFNAEAY